MTTLIKQFRTGFMGFVMMTLICGVLYTFAVTGFAKILFPNQASGSMIQITSKDGTHQTYGSELIGQAFSKPQYLIGRPEGITNLSVVSREERNEVNKRIAWLHRLDPQNQAEIPSDLVMASGSGVDPHITPASAAYQVDRIAKERRMNASAVRAIIDKYTDQRFLGFWGEPGVHVLKVNLALDGLL